MQTRTLLAAVATAAIAAIVTPSISSAQDTTVKKTSAGEVAMKPTYNSLMSAISAAAATNTKIKALTTVNASDVQLVNVDDLLQGNDPKALSEALTKNLSDIDALRTSLASNATIGALFAAADTSASAVSSMASTKPALKDIVAADVSSDNKVTVYYWKKPGGSDK